MPLYERLMGWTEEDVKISVHAFTALMREFARGRITGAQAQRGIESVSGEPLSPEAVTEAQSLLASITGNATAKLARAGEIDDVLMLAEAGVPPYDTPSAVRARLGA